MRFVWPLCWWLYWYAGAAPVPTKLVKAPVSIEPPAFSGAVNVTGVTPEATVSEPVAAAVIWVSTEGGTVNVRCPALVTQMKVEELVTALVPVPVVLEVPPMISTRSDALPPVQLIVRGELRTTVEGKPPVTVSALASPSEVVNDPTSAPPAPVKV